MFWVRGYVTASVPGENAERFINILPRHSIAIYRLCSKNGRCYFDIDKRDYLALRPIAGKTGCFPKLHKKCGGYYLFIGMLRHTGLYLGIFMFVVLSYILSLFLWQIEFSGNMRHTEEQLLQYMNEQGIGFGSRCSHIDCAGLEAAIRQKYNDISWVSVEIRGSRMMIRIHEAEFIETKEEEILEKTHIVAGQNGIVTEIITRAGTALVTAGDQVQKGDILIAGVVNTVNEYNELTERVPVTADGDISILSEIPYSDGIPLTYSMKVMTGKQKNGFSVSLFNKKIFSYIPSIPYERYDIITTTANWKISKNLYLPVSHDTISCMEYIEHDACRSSSQLSEICYRRYLEKMEQYIMDGYRIENENVELQLTDDQCILQGVVTLEGPFWERTLFSSEELEGVDFE